MYLNLLYRLNLHSALSLQIQRNLQNSIHLLEGAKSRQQGAEERGEEGEHRVSQTRSDIQV